MKIKRNHNAFLPQKIGAALRLIRMYNGESPDAIALVLGYKYASSYCKLERGEVQEVCIESLLNFCEHFNISFSIFLLIIGLDGDHTLPPSIVKSNLSITTLDEDDQLVLRGIINLKKTLNISDAQSL